MAVSYETLTLVLIGNDCRCGLPLPLFNKTNFCNTIITNELLARKIRTFGLPLGTTAEREKNILEWGAQLRGTQPHAGDEKGDHVLFYHSNEGLCVVGIAKVVKEAYQDPTTDETAWVCVDIAPHKTLKNPVTLESIKKVKALANIPLVRIPRLSVMPVTPEEYDLIIEMSSGK